MRVIYIVGPYRARTEDGVRRNIRNAEEVAANVWERGVACICPHLNSAFMGGIRDDNDRTLLDGDLEILSRCDAVLALNGWRTSEGSRAELDRAQSCNIPILYSQQELTSWLRS